MDMGTRNQVHLIICSRAPSLLGGYGDEKSGISALLRRRCCGYKGGKSGDLIICHLPSSVAVDGYEDVNSG